MRIRKLNAANRKEKREFTQLPFQIYKDCPQWVPPLASEMALVLDRKRHPFYRHSEADFFLAESEGQAVGRIAVLHNQNFSAHHKTPTAFFYYFESIDDPAVSQALFDAAFDWARQRGITLMLGPKGFLRSSGLGVLVEGFEYLPAVGIPYNLPYYPRLVEAAGFEKETDHLSGYLFKSLVIPERVQEVAAKVQQRNQFWIKTFKSKQEMRAWIPKVDQVHHEAFQNNPGFYPSTPEEFALLANNMIQVADPQLIKLIMHGEDVAGFVIGYANINAALQRTHGQMWPFGWMDILLELRRAKQVDLNGIGILPQYQGLGSNALLYVELNKTLQNFHFDQAELVQIDERNFKSRSDMETMGVQWLKRHRTYRKILE